MNICDEYSFVVYDQQFQPRERDREREREKAKQIYYILLILILILPLLLLLIIITIVIIIIGEIIEKRRNVLLTKSFGNILFQRP